jgi:molecular chaperone Hsp33
MSIEEIKNLYRNRDRVIKALDISGNLRVAITRNSNTTRTAQEKHIIGPVQAFYLARLLTASSLMASFLKGEERMILEIDSDGFIRKVFAESLHLGEVRGFVRINESMDFSNLESREELLLNGKLKVTRILYNKSEPVTGIVSLKSGDLSSDLSHYFTQSEQIPSTVLLDADFDDEGIITHSGGVIIQALPGARPQELREAYDRLTSLGRLSALYSENTKPEEIINVIFPDGYEIIDSIRLDFFCRCSKEKFIDKLITLDYREISDMKEQKHNELVCQYCNAHYYLEDKDFDKILEDKTAQRN